MASYIIIHSIIYICCNITGMYRFINIFNVYYTYILICLRKLDKFLSNCLKMWITSNSDTNLQWLPESTIFDMTTGKTDRAVSTLERVARENKKSLPIGRLVMDRFYQAHHGQLKDVLSKEMCKTSALLWLVW